MAAVAQDYADVLARDDLPPGSSLLVVVDEPLWTFADGYAHRVTVRRFDGDDNTAVRSAAWRLNLATALTRDALATNFLEFVWGQLLQLLTEDERRGRELRLSLEYQIARLS